MKIESKVWTTKSDPSSAPSSMNGRTNGSVMRRKDWKAFAPSTRAASRTSGFCDCRPARMISIMNGVQRQTSTATTVTMGYLLTQSTRPSPNGVNT